MLFLSAIAKDLSNRSVTVSPELQPDIPVSLEARFTLTYWTIQAVNTLSTVFAGVVSAVRPQLTPAFTTRLVQHKATNSKMSYYCQSILML